LFDVGWNGESSSTGVTGAVDALSSARTLLACRSKLLATAATWLCEVGWNGESGSKGGVSLGCFGFVVIGFKLCCTFNVESRFIEGWGSSPVVVIAVVTASSIACGKKYGGSSSAK
jgi:hypothetical protein